MGQKPQSLKNLETLVRQEVAMYRKLLNILEQETQALVQAQEENILSLAAAKETILAQLQEIQSLRHDHGWLAAQGGMEEELVRLKQRVAAVNRGNRQIIEAGLEVIQEFLEQFQPSGPGTYRPAGQVQAGAGRALFHRRA